jgi:hypothetical protein
MAKRTCSEEGCDRPAHARGLCVRDWNRHYRHGTLPEPPSAEQRFWSRVDRRGPDECWPWLWGCNGQGYGTFFVKAGELGLARNKQIGAHRVAFFLIHGRWPEPLALHGCDNPPCCNAVNPEHVHEGDGCLNMQEMVARDRQPPHLRGGETHAAAKFTNEQVRQIRERYAAGGISLHELAVEFGVVERCIAAIVRRKVYRGVD